MIKRRAKEEEIMKPMDRSRRWKKEWAAFSRFPLLNRSDCPDSAPTPFNGDWFHSTDVTGFGLITNGGWCPKCMANSIYGAAIYFARGRWNELPCYFRCRLVVDKSDSMSSFLFPSGQGNTQDDVIAHLNHYGVRASRSASPGYSGQNTRIRNFFQTTKIKAIHFIEHGIEVVAVYDPNAICVSKTGKW